MLLPAPMESRSPPMTVLVVGRHYAKLYAVNRGQCQNMFNNKYYGVLSQVSVIHMKTRFKGNWTVKEM